MPNSGVHNLLVDESLQYLLLGQLGKLDELEEVIQSLAWFSVKLEKGTS